MLFTLGYYSYIVPNMTLCYTVFLSRVITSDITLKSSLALTLTSIFSIFFFVLFLLKDEFEVENAKTIQNVLNPTTKYEDLYESRIHQAEKLINIIKSKESDGGYAICISGNWGSGKTSFVNAVLDKLDFEFKDNSSDISVSEIRINAMELDNQPALVNYLFNRIKEILKENGVYVGLNSEYQELVSSLTGTIMTETAGNFLKNKLSSNSDYRENLSNLSQLIGTQMINKKIVIVVDDLERCTKEKTLDFLFFIKEIAMLNRCVILFLSDYTVLQEHIKNYSVLDEFFLEKFFNYKINLQSVNTEDIFQKSINDNEFFNFIDESKMIFLNEIEKASNKHYLDIKAEERSYYKEKAVGAKNEDYDLFLANIGNPRQLIKAYKKYGELIDIVEKPKEKLEMEELKEYTEFINKVDYKKQIFIISMLYEFNTEQYEYIEYEGIEVYLGKFYWKYTGIIDERVKEDNVIDVLANEEWISYDNYMSKEKIRFVSCLLSTPCDLTRIVTGFTSLQEEYKSLIDKHMKPDDTSLSNVLKVIINANFSSEEEKKSYILKAMQLYKEGMNLDEAILQISSEKLFHYVAQENCIFELFYKTFKDTKCIDKQACLKKFISFAQRYLDKKLNDISRYTFLLDSKNNDWTYLNKVVFNKQDCSSMIEAYYDKLTKELDLQLKSQSTIESIEKLCDITDTYCKENNISNLPDIVNMSMQARKTIESIEYLMKIEHRINSNEDSKFRNTIIGVSISERLDDAINLIKNKNDEEVYKLQNSISILFDEIVNSNYSITKEDLEKINIIIDLYFTIFEEPRIFWRKKYIKLKQRIEDEKVD